MVVVINFYHSFVAKYVIIQFGVIKFVSTFQHAKVHARFNCLCARHMHTAQTQARLRCDTNTFALMKLLRIQHSRDRCEWRMCIMPKHRMQYGMAVWGERKFGILCFSSIAPKTAEKYVGCLHYIAASKLTQFSDIIQQTNTDCHSHRIRADLMIEISNRPGYLILDPTTWRMTLNYDHWHQRLYENDTIRLLTCTRLSFVVIGQCHLYFLHGCSINICHAAC